MTARLNKPAPWCKTSLLLVLLSGNTTGIASPAETRSLRDCVAQARNTQAVAACEASHRATLTSNIEQWTKAIRIRLDGRQRARFEHNVRAWEIFRVSEVAMLDISLQQRSDGLGPTLHAGAVTRLFEDRERQLREHLHNLSQPGTPPSTDGSPRREQGFPH